jgi:hypothetical protein
VKIIATVDEKNDIKPLASDTLDDKSYDSIIKDLEDMDLGWHHRL